MGTRGHTGEGTLSADRMATANALKMKAQDGVIAPNLPASFSQRNPFSCPSQKARKRVQRSKQVNYRGSGHSNMTRKGASGTSPSSYRLQLSGRGPAAGG